MLAPTLIFLAATLLVAGGLAGLPPFRSCLADIDARAPQIDGLRGLCALLVAAHHLVYFLYYRSTGAWRIPRSDHGLETMGKAAVAYFFLICAYLFWGKLFRRGLVIDIAFVARFMRGRLRRLVPLYVVAMLFSLLVIGFIGMGCRLEQGAAETVIQILQSISFSFFGEAAFNGSFLTYAATSVAWSLRYEWVFYAVLPALAILGANRLWFVTLPVLLVANATWFQVAYLDYFAYGAIACELTKLDPKMVAFATLSRLARCIWNLASLSAALVVLGMARGVDVGVAPTSLLLFLSFLPIARGADWFGLLRTDAARLIGAISYSLYLLNIPLLHVMGGLWLDGGALGLPASAAVGTLSLVAMIACCTLTYRSIERRFIADRVAHHRAVAVDARPADEAWAEAKPA